MADKINTDFVKSIELGSKTLLMYPENHPRTQHAIQTAYDLVSRITGERDSVTISAAEDNLLLDGEVLERGNPVLDKFYRELVSRNIHSLTFARGITVEELLVLFRHLNLKPARIQEMGGFEKILQNENIRTIYVNKIKYGIIEEGTANIDQNLLSELLFAVQAIVSGSSDADMAAQNLEKSLDSSEAPDPAGLLMRIFQMLAQRNPELVEETSQNDSLKDRFVDLYRSFTPNMQAKLLLAALVKGDLENAAVGGFHKKLTAHELENSMLNVLDQPVQESELSDFFARLQGEEGISISEVVRRKMEQRGLIKRESLPPLAEELLKKESLSAEEIGKSGEAMAQLLLAQNFNDADRLSKKIFAYLGTGQQEQKIAAIQALSGIIATLSQNEKWKNVEFSLSFLVSTYFRKETDQAVLQAFLSYLFLSFKKHYQAKNFAACHDLLNTIRGPVEKNEALKRHFSDQVSSYAQVLMMDLVETGGGAEVAFECLKLVSASSAELLLDLLGEEEEQGRRLRLIHSITNLDRTIVLSAMEKRLSDPRWFVVRNVATLLGKMNLRETPPVFYQLASHPDARVAKELIKNFYKSFSRLDAPLILMLLQHPDKGVRMQAVHLVANNNLEGATSQLLWLAGSSSPADTDLRAACLQALLKMKVAEAVTPALASLDRKLGNKAELAERNAAVRILGELSRSQTLSVLQRIASSDPNSETRALAAKYL